MSFLLRNEGPGSGESLFWVGIRGYEDRGLESLRNSMHRDADIVGICDLTYHTRLAPEAGGSQRLLDVSKTFSDLLKAYRLEQVRFSRDLDAYRFAPLRRVLTEVERNAISLGATMVIDVTCMTGMHAVAVGSWLEDGWSGDVPVRVDYTSPAQYVYPEWKVASGWTDTVLAPIMPYSLPARSPSHSLSVSQGANALVLLGYDGLRTEWGLRQLDAASVWFALAHAEDVAGADLAATVSRAAHKKLLDETVLRDDWQSFEVSKDGMGQFRFTVESIAGLSVEENRKLFILPFGPRILSVIATLASVSLSRRNAWICYPVPDRVFSESSIGVGPTYWYSASERLTDRP